MLKFWGGSLLLFSRHLGGIKKWSLGPWWLPLSCLELNSLSKRAQRYHKQLLCYLLICPRLFQLNHSLLSCLVIRLRFWNSFTPPLFWWLTLSAAALFPLFLTHYHLLINISYLLSIMVPDSAAGLQVGLDMISATGSLTNPDSSLWQTRLLSLHWNETTGAFMVTLKGFSRGFISIFKNAASEDQHWLTSEYTPSSHISR